MLPRWVNEGLIIKNRDENDVSKYDFQFKNLRGYKTTIEGLSHKFNPRILELCETDFRNFKTRNAN